MVKGIKITKGVGIKDARPKDEVVDSTLPGSLKIYKSFIFKGEAVNRTTINSFVGCFAYIQRVKHGLDFTPAYSALISYDDGFESVPIPFNDFIGVGGGSHFVNVTPTDIIVGFDAADIDGGVRMRMKVIIYAERLDV